jgi:hypothetical protein
MMADDVVDFGCDTKDFRGPHLAAWRALSFYGDLNVEMVMAKLQLELQWAFHSECRFLARLLRLRSD